MKLPYWKLADPISEGYKAGQNGTSHGCNPFADDPEKCALWEEGWQRGMLDSMRYSGAI